MRRLRKSEQILVMDPGLAEEHVMDSSLLLAMNAHREICMIHKSGGASCEPEHVSSCLPPSPSISVGGIVGGYVW